MLHYLLVLIDAVVTVAFHIAIFVIAVGINGNVVVLLNVAFALIVADYIVVVLHVIELLLLF